MFSPSVENALRIERDLNSIFIENIPVGGLFSKLLFITIREDSRINDYNKFYIPFFIILKTIKNRRRTKRICGKKLILGFTSNRRNFKNLVCQQKKYYDSEYLLYGPEIAENEENGYSFDEFPNVSTLKCLTILLQCTFLFPRILKIFYSNGFRCGVFNIFNYLFVQILKAESFKFFLQDVRFVLVDYDRSFPMAPLVLAANALNINNATLIHGTINPVYGYQPFLAKEVWCWGEFQKLQLQKLGVDLKRIRIVGNPAVQEIKHFPNPPTDIHGYNVGVILDRHNKKFIEFLQKSLKELKHLKIKIIFKTHPMMAENEFMKDWLDNTYNYCVIDKLTSSKDFFSQCHMVVTKGSSMSFEALINEIPVVLVNLPDGTGVQENLDLMEKLLSMDVISRPEELAQVLSTFEPLNKRKIKIQKQNLLTNFYFKTGQEAAKEIAQNIEEFVKPSRMKKYKEGNN